MPVPDEGSQTGMSPFENGSHRAPDPHAGAGLTGSQATSPPPEEELLLLDDDDELLLLDEDELLLLLLDDDDELLLLVLDDDDELLLLLLLLLLDEDDELLLLLLLDEDELLVEEAPPLPAEAQRAGSSSEPSAQSLTALHVRRAAMQPPSSHRNWLELQPAPPPWPPAPVAEVLVGLELLLVDRTPPAPSVSVPKIGAPVPPQAASPNTV